MTLPFAAETATPLLLIALIAAATLLMLQLAVGPFGHMKFIHVHKAYLKWPVAVRHSLTTLSVAIILLALTHLTGFWSFQNPL